MVKYILFIFLLAELSYGCDRIKNSAFQKSAVVFDTVALHVMLDSITAHMIRRDSSYCDSMLIHFNNAELAKQYPELVAFAYLKALVSHNTNNARLMNEFHKLVTQANSEHLTGWENYLIGRSQEIAENYKDAIQFYLPALPVFEIYRDTFGLELCYGRLGLMYRFYQSEFKEGSKYFRRLLQVTHDSARREFALRELKNCYDGLDMPDSTLYYLNQLRLLNYNGGQEFVNNFLLYELNEMIELKPGSEDSVKKYYEVFTDLQTERKNYEALIFTHMMYGTTLLRLGRTREAENMLNKGLMFSKECPDCLKENGELYDAMYTLYDSTNNPKLALKYLKLKNESDTKFNFAELRSEVKKGEENFRFKQEQQRLILEKEKKDVQLSAERKQKYFFVAGFAVVALFGGIVFVQRTRIKKAKTKSDELLLNILPQEVADELKANGSAAAKQFDHVTVMFTDFKNFTQIAEKLSPNDLVAELDCCFKAFDHIIDKYNIEKIKTIGDSYMCAGGLPVPNKTNATDVVSAAVEIQSFMSAHMRKRLSEHKDPFEIRIGVHTGPVVAGIVGVKKFAYDIWGDAVNVASRMESSGEAGRINISGATYEFVRNHFKCTYRGKVQAKNKGAIDMYFIDTNQ